MAIERALAQEVLLRRRGLVFLTASEAPPMQPPVVIQAFEIELIELGFVLSTRLGARLRQLDDATISELRHLVLRVLGEQVGSDRVHQPLYKSFPHGIPESTPALWLRAVLVHFLQEEEQPCLFCGRLGTTHVLSPCLHVVCDHCFDGSNYNGCPVCGSRCEGSPFFEPAAAAKPSKGQPAAGRAPVARLKLLDWGDDLPAKGRELFQLFCQRPQALSPVDRQDLTLLVRDFGEELFAFLPPAIPLRENVALIFGTLLQQLPAEKVLAVGRPYLKTATDVLRLIAAYSGADPALQVTHGFCTVKKSVPHSRWWGAVARLLGAEARLPQATAEVQVPIAQRRFRVARLARPLRRALLAFLESLAEDHLFEDLLRHRSYWVWVGQFLHPHEYADRFPKVARGFAMLRRKSPSGRPGPAFSTFAARVEKALAQGDGARLLDLLATRPGELGRRFDHALRVLSEADRQVLLQRFAGLVGVLPAPMLLTLRHHLPLRAQPVACRIFWPKGAQAKGVSAPDKRPPLPAAVIDEAGRTIEAELLRRYASRSPCRDMVIDRRLHQVIVPFNERTASPAAVALPRGSHLPLADSNVLRLFLHWCEPPDGQRTDIDLSIGFYDEAWKYLGVCSYYHLNLMIADICKVAVSSGDFTSAPFPNGASEFVDLHVDRARQAGFRYAVMVVNAYAGLPFSQLERAFAGLMLRDSEEGAPFDPQAVELKFQLQGHNGVFLPLVIDLEKNTLHWLDTWSKGQFAFNNVASSTSAICKICPEMIGYFASGARADMGDLALLHAAARAERVFLRGDDGEVEVFERAAGEEPATFLSRLRQDRGRSGQLSELTAPCLALLAKGDLELPEGTETYALFRGKLNPNLAAADLI